MKYIKKEEFKNTLHNFVGKYGERVTISSDTMDDDYIFEMNKFMFDVLEEEEVVEDNEEISESIEEEVVEETEAIVDEQTPAEEQNILEELEECSTPEQVNELAEANGIDLDGRIKNLKKLKDNFIEELSFKE